MHNQISEAVRVLERNCILPRNEVERAEVFAAFAVIRRSGEARTGVEPVWPTDFEAA